LSLADLMGQPTLRAHYDFVSHRETVSESIERNRRFGNPMDTFREDAEFGAGLRNVVSDPAVIHEVTRQVFNLICYLNYSGRDQERRLNDPRAQARITKAKGRSRKIAEARALQDGCRWIEFCGYRSSFERPQSHGGTVSGHWRRGHWRRGHWRNQRFGKALAETKLMWIRPTMVKGQGGAADTRAAVYDATSQRR
jgi:hypothetical protein